MRTCIKCNRTRNLAVCIACGEHICPSHRCGTGDLSLGYTCLNHMGFGYAVSVMQQRDQKETWWAAPPWQWWIVLAILVAVLFVLPYIMQVRP